MFKLIKAKLVLLVPALMMSGCFDSDSNDLPEPPAVNQAPTADSASFTTQTEVTINASLTGSDADGNAITFALVQAPSRGMVTVSDSGDFTYVPELEFTGTDSFSFRVTDSLGASAEATIDITIEALMVLFSNVSRDAFAQPASAEPLRVNGRIVTNDVVDPTAFDNLLVD